jgi:hypothetical protein
MNAEPQKFFVGLVDLFAVWLPGALLAYLVQADLQSAKASLGYVPGEPIERWAVFLLISYILGNFVFLIGSVTLDPLYDALKKRLGATRGRFGRWFWRSLFKEQMKPAQERVCQLKKERLDDGDLSIGAFQWAKARLALDHPEALAIVHRFEADSKFFRSLAVALVVLDVWALATGRGFLVTAFPPLLVGALWRFVEQRAKSTIQAYWFVITLEGEAERALTRP